MDVAPAHKAWMTALHASQYKPGPSTSAVKSTCPGVSIRLSRWSCQEQERAAELIVMPLAYSSG